MARVAREQEELENRIGESEDKRKRTKRALKEALESSNLPEIREPDAEEQGPGHETRGLELPTETTRSRRPTIAQLTNNAVSDDESEADEEFFDAVDAGDVEVVDARDAMPPTSPPATEPDEPSLSAVADSAADDGTSARETEIAKSYKGYEDGLRKRLKLDADNRPKVGLWVRLTRSVVFTNSR